MVALSRVQPVYVDLDSLLFLYPVQCTNLAGGRPSATVHNFYQRTNYNAACTCEQLRKLMGLNCVYSPLQIWLSISMTKWDPQSRDVMHKSNDISS